MSDSVDTSAQDRGFYQCLHNAGLEEGLIKALCSKDGDTRGKELKQFFYYFEPDSLSAGIEALLGSFPEYRKSRYADRPNHNYLREASHIRQAWATAKRLVTDMETTPPDEDVDWERPLPPGTHVDLGNKWTLTYNFQIRPEFNPDENTVTRYFRALTKNRNIMKVVKIEAHKPLGTTTGLKKPEGGCNTLYGWYRHGRTMAYAFAKAGNHMVQEKDGAGEVREAPLDVFQNYVDESYELALQRNSLEWLKERDEMIRTLMVDRFKKGYSMGASLTWARNHAHFHWQDATLFKDRLKLTSGGSGAPVALPPRELPRAKTPPRDGGGTPNTPRKDKKKKKDKGSGKGKERERSRTPPRRTPTNTSLFCSSGKGQTLCDNWNMGEKCKDRECKKLHNFCSRKLTTGGACGGRHPAYKCTNPDRVRASSVGRRSPLKR